jgi:hypothetical protein
MLFLFQRSQSCGKGIDRARRLIQLRFCVDLNFLEFKELLLQESDLFFRRVLRRLFYRCA